MEHRQQLEQLLQRLEYQFVWLNQGFAQRLATDFGIDPLPASLAEWPSMSFAQFDAALAQLLALQPATSCSLRDWEEYLALMQGHFHKLQHDIALTKTELLQHP